MDLAGLPGVEMMLRAPLLLALLWAAPAPSRAQDMPLSQVLIDGEGWERVAGGLKFADACCADAAGNFYFSDAAVGGAVMKVDPSGAVSEFVAIGSGISGMQFGPGGTLYACQPRARRIVAFAPGAAKPEVVVGAVRPNDLVVTADRRIYFTETPTGRVYRVDLDDRVRKLRIAAEGLTRPNGIALSPRGGTLLVSDHDEREVTFFRVGPGGALAHAAPYASLRLRGKNLPSKGDGADVDAAGRCYVTADVGLHMFDPTGRLGGVILPPDPAKPIASVAFAGEGLGYLYLANGDAIYRRKVKTKGTGR